MPELRRLFRLATSDIYERLVRDEDLAVARTLHARGLHGAIDFLGEQVRDAAEAERAVDGHLELARRLSEGPLRDGLLAELGPKGSLHRTGYTAARFVQPPAKGTPPC